MDENARPQPLEVIDPVPFRGDGGRRRARRPIQHWVVPLLLVIVALGTAGAVSLMLTGREIRIVIEPTPDSLQLRGPWPRIQLEDRFLLRGGTYELSATLEGYHPLEETVEIGPTTPDPLAFALRRLPGEVSILVVQAGGPDVPSSRPSIEGAAILVDGQRLTRPAVDLQLEAGSYLVRAEHPRFQPMESAVEVEGGGRRQLVILEIAPDWAEVTVDSTPAGAEVMLDGRLVGSTPLTLEVLSGDRTLELRAEGFEPWRRQLEVAAEEPVALTGIVLEPARGLLAIRTEPPGAQVTVGGRYAGVAPLEVEVAPNVEQPIGVVLDGFEPASRTVRLEPGERAAVALELQQQFGEVRLEVTPPEATLTVDGTPWGAIEPSITLSAVAHELTFEAEGYTPVTRTVRPRPSIPDRLVIALERIHTEIPAGVTSWTAANGTPLELITPSTFQMGASRREQGRRSNETLRTVRLERPFLIGAREITNGEFEEFQPSHRSGTVGTVSLDGDDRPVVNVSWDDAARFCNWLSAQDGLPAAYVELNGTMQAVTPMSIGYRLPTEAEWEYAARHNGADPLLKYPWGTGFPPQARTGNYGDQSASAILNPVLDGYTDDHAGTAPVASFDANDLNLHDMGGNVAEWCHDYYAIYAPQESEDAVDPTGPTRGRHRVIRGSSWRHASMTALRFSYRDYSAEPRDDVGFRICRYVSEPEPASP